MCEAGIPPPHISVRGCNRRALLVRDAGLNLAARLLSGTRTKTRVATARLDLFSMILNLYIRRLRLVLYKCEFLRSCRQVYCLTFHLYARRSQYNYRDGRGDRTIDGMNLFAKGAHRHGDMG